MFKKGRESEASIYHRYDPELRVKIAKYACENGNKSTVELFSAQLGFTVSLKLMDVNLPLGTKTLNIMVVKLIGFTVLFVAWARVQHESVAQL